MRGARPSGGRAGPSPCAACCAGSAGWWGGTSRWGPALRPQRPRHCRGDEVRGPGGQDSGAPEPTPLRLPTTLRQTCSLTCWVGPCPRCRAPGREHPPPRPRAGTPPPSGDPACASAPRAGRPGPRQGLHVRVLGAGLLAVPLRLPALVAVDELREEGGLLGVARDELVLQELFGRGPLPGGRARHQARGQLGSAPQTPEPPPSEDAARGAGGPGQRGGLRSGGPC